MSDNLSKAYQNMTLDQLGFMLTIAQLAGDDTKVLMINNYIKEKLKLQ